MGWKENKPTCPTSEECKSLCDELAGVEIQCLKNVDTSALEDGDILCYHAASGTFVNLSKADVFGQYDIYVDGGSLNLYELVLTDNNAETPDVIVDMSGLPETLCDDADFIAALAVKIDTDAQTAAQVPYEPADATGPLGATKNVAAALDLANQCLKGIKDGSIFDFQISGDTITWTVNGNPLTVDVTHPVLAQVSNDDGTNSLTVDGVAVYTSPLFTFSTAVNGDHELYADGVLVGLWDDADTVSSPHPDYSLEKDLATGYISLIKDGVIVATVVDNDTVSTPHPEMTFSPNALNGTDVLIDGVVVYTIPDSDTDVVITQTGPNEYTLIEGGVTVGVINTIPDTDTDTVLVAGAQTVNPDGSITQCFTTTDTTDNSTPNGLNDVCFTIPSASGNTSTFSANAATRSYVHGDGDGNDTPLPIATVTPCNHPAFATPTGLVDDKWVRDFTVRGHAWSNADIVNYTTPCNRSLTSSLLSSVTAVYAMAGSSFRSEAGGIRSTVLASSDTTAAGTASASLGTVAAIATPILLSGTGATAVGVRSTDTGVEINGTMCGAYSSNNPKIATVFAASTYSGAIFTSDATVDGTYSSARSTTGTVIDVVPYSTDTSGFNNRINSQITSMQSSTETIAPNDQTLVSGSGAPNTQSSANRTREFDVATGNHSISGTYTGGAVFPGFGECAVSDGNTKIPLGTAVVFTGLHKVRVAKKGERPDGVTVAQLAMCAGGGIDPDNSPFELDENGIVVIAEEVKKVEVEVSDEKENAKNKASFIEAVGKYNNAVTELTDRFAFKMGKAASEEEVSKLREELNKNTSSIVVPVSPTEVFKTEIQEVKTRYRKPNTKLDNKEQERVRDLTVQVEFMGRNFINVPKPVKPREYVGSGGTKVDADLGYRVLDMHPDGKRALVLITPPR